MYSNNKYEKNEWDVVIQNGIQHQSRMELELAWVLKMAAWGVPSHRYLFKDDELA
jgi:hypothetical protein